MRTTYLVTNGFRREFYNVKKSAIERAKALGADYVVKRVNRACNGLVVVYPK
jgi:hypothetical protein